VYKACVQSGRLSDRAKHLFTKDPDVRTSKDIKEIFRAVEKLQCFSKYSRAVKQGLAKFVYYSDYPPDRVVVQQGKFGINLKTSAKLNSTINDAC
jgi:hypothetical protein